MLLDYGILSCQILLIVGLDLFFSKWTLMIFDIMECSNSSSNNHHLQQTNNAVSHGTSWKSNEKS